MPLTYVSGDPLLTRAEVLAFGFNLRGKIETTPLHTRLMDRYPAAFASYRKQCQGGRIKPGTLWIWRESQPALAFLVVRESPVGATRLRFVEAIAMTLARDYRLLGISSLAIAPLTDSLEWPVLRPALEYWLAPSPLPVLVYESDLTGVMGAG